MTKTLVNNTIKEYLLDEGYRDDRVELINIVACKIHDHISELGVLYLELIKYFIDPKCIAVEQGRILQAVNVLIAEGYVKLYKGEYILTKRGDSSFNV